MNLIYDAIKIILTAVLSALFTNFAFNYKKLYEVNIVRYKEFYIKYVEFLHTCQNVGYDYSKFSSSDRNYLYNLIYSNLHHLDEFTLQHLDSYKKLHQLCLVRDEGCSTEDVKLYVRKATHIFLSLSLAIVAESIQLSQAIKHPNTAKALYDEMVCIQKNYNQDSTQHK